MIDNSPLTPIDFPPFQPEAKTLGKKPKAKTRKKKPILDDNDEKIQYREYNGLTIRVVNFPDYTWFVIKDIVTALETSPGTVQSYIPDDNLYRYPMPTGKGGFRKLNLIGMPDLWEMLDKTRLHTAGFFKNWLIREANGRRMRLP